MKLRLYLEVDGVSRTTAATMQRSGFNLEPDGTGMKITMPNTPSIPKRKVRTTFVENPKDTLAETIEKSQE